MCTNFKLKFETSQTSIFILILKHYTSRNRCVILIPVLEYSKKHQPRLHIWAIAFHEGIAVLPCTPKALNVHHQYLRKSHVIAGVQRHFDDGGTVDVHFSTGGGVSTGHSAGLVESMRFHTTCVITYKHLQDDGLLHTLELRGLVKGTAADE